LPPIMSSKSHVLSQSPQRVCSHSLQLRVHSSQTALSHVSQLSSAGPLQSQQTDAFRFRFFFSFVAAADSFAAYSRRRSSVGIDSAAAATALFTSTAKSCAAASSCGAAASSALRLGIPVRDSNFSSPAATSCSCAAPSSRQCPPLSEGCSSATAQAWSPSFAGRSSIYL